jgi:uncharacterized protein (DUF111 family)
MLTVLCRAAEQDKFTRLVFRHTTTLGVRRGTVERAVLSRSEHTRETKYGPVRVKRSEGWGVTREKPEYDDLAEIARREGCAIYELDL